MLKTIRDIPVVLITLFLVFTSRVFATVFLISFVGLILVEQYKRFKSGSKINANRIANIARKKMDHEGVRYIDDLGVIVGKEAKDYIEGKMIGLVRNKDGVVTAIAYNKNRSLLELLFSFTYDLSVVFELLESIDKLVMKRNEEPFESAFKIVTNQKNYD